MLRSQGPCVAPRLRVAPGLRVTPACPLPPLHVEESAFLVTNLQNEVSKVS